MKVLIIGGGGREHAICWKIKTYSENYEIFSFPGNGGISLIGKCIKKDVSNFEEVWRL
jgi:Phosphoribosylamine-glycine ligase